MRVFWGVSSITGAGGVLFWEILAYGAMPYKELRNFQMVRWLKMGNRLELSEALPEVIRREIIQCWAMEPEARPPFKKV